MFIENAVTYKWDPKTYTGYRLSFDGQGSGGGFQVEDWDHCVMVGEWGCDTLEDALKVLDHFFELDVTEESDLIRRHFASQLH